MNFFEHQDKARSKTRNLLGLFLLSILMITTIINLAVIFFFSASKQENTNASLSENFINNFSWPLFFEIGLVVLVFIIIISLYKRIELSSGGKVIAEKLGGKLILENTTDFHEKRLLNIVAEISIASGVYPPPVYLLIDEDGINAFAAGFSIDDAVIGITRGAIKNLNRDELQGVIAHEFSHIFNGDMRLNLKLISILHGILVIGILGNFIFYSSQRSRDKNGTQLLFFGLAIIVIGSIGTFFGNLIKASISRQREFLADASAVQFTRNPAGIGSALKKIGAFATGSKILNPHSSEASHMFFAQGLSGFNTDFMATHPPLKTRILMIDPKWDGSFENIITQKNDDHEVLRKPDDKHKKTTSFASIAGATMVQNIGNIDQKSINQAHDLIGAIPQIIKDETSHSFGARAIIYSLIIAENAGFEEKQLQILKDNSDLAVFDLTNKLQSKIEKMDKEFRLTLIELTIPSLRQLSLPQYQNFKKTVELLAKVDDKINLFEWSLMKILFNHLDREFNENYVKKTTIYKLQSVQSEISLFLSLMAQVGNKDLKIAEELFKSTILNQNLPKASFISEEKISIQDLDKSIIKLEKLYPLEKEKLLKLCNICLLENEILFSEIELLRAFSSILHCPMPLVSH